MGQAILNNEEIKPVALAVVELRLSENKVFQLEPVIAWYFHDLSISIYTNIIFASPSSKCLAMLIYRGWND